MVVAIAMACLDQEMEGERTKACAEAKSFQEASHFVHREIVVRTVVVDSADWRPWSGDSAAVEVAVAQEKRVLVAVVGWAF